MTTNHPTDEQTIIGILAILPGLADRAGVPVPHGACHAMARRLLPLLGHQTCRAAALPCSLFQADPLRYSLGIETGHGIRLTRIALQAVRIWRGGNGDFLNIPHTLNIQRRAANLMHSVRTMLTGTDASFRSLQTPGADWIKSGSAQHIALIGCLAVLLQHVPAIPTKQHHPV